MTSQNKMAAVIWGTFAQFIWATIGEIFFEQLYLSQERKYQALTYRYDFTYVKRH